MDKMSIEIGSRKIRVLVSVGDTYYEKKQYEMEIPAMACRCGNGSYLFGKSAYAATLVDPSRLVMLNETDRNHAGVFSAFMGWLKRYATAYAGLSTEVSLNVIMPGDRANDKHYVNDIVVAAQETDFQNVTTTDRAMCIYLDRLQLDEGEYLVIIDTDTDPAMATVLHRDRESGIKEVAAFSIDGISLSCAENAIGEMIGYPEMDGMDIMRDSMMAEIVVRMASGALDNLMAGTDTVLCSPEGDAERTISRSELYDAMSLTSNASIAARKTAECLGRLCKSTSAPDYISKLRTICLFGRLFSLEGVQDAFRKAFNSAMISSNKLTFTGSGATEWIPCSGALISRHQSISVEF